MDIQENPQERNMCCDNRTRMNMSNCVLYNQQPQFAEITTSLNIVSVYIASQRCNMSAGDLFTLLVNILRFCLVKRYES